LLLPGSQPSSSVFARGLKEGIKVRRLCSEGKKAGRLQMCLTIALGLGKVLVADYKWDSP
jgi:hypothetical protein